MYHKKTHPLVKETVEKEFCKVNGSVRVVFCTIAFGMGINVEGAYIALHLGPSSCLAAYSGCTRSKNITNGMKEYVRNTDVRRHSLLIQPFLNCQEKPAEETRIERHSCCDVCAKTCRCLCLCKGKCTCDNVCNSEWFFSPMEAISESNIVKMIEQCSSDYDTDDSDIYIRSRICHSQY